jgi:hypothetical protein
LFWPRQPNAPFLQWRTTTHVGSVVSPAHSKVSLEEEVISLRPAGHVDGSDHVAWTCTVTPSLAHNYSVSYAVRNPVKRRHNNIVDRHRCGIVPPCRPNIEHQWKQTPAVPEPLSTLAWRCKSADPSGVAQKDSFGLNWEFLKEDTRGSDQHHRGGPLQIAYPVNPWVHTS